MTFYRAEDLGNWASVLMRDLRGANDEVVWAMYRRTGDKHDAEDAASAAAEKFLRHLDRQGSVELDNLTGWLIHEAKHQHLAAVMRSRSRTRKEREWAIYANIRDYVASIEDEDRVVNGWLLRLMRDRLTVREMAVLFMHHVDGMTYQEISALTGWGSARTIGDWARRAIQKLKKHEDELE